MYDILMQRDVESIHTIKKNLVKVTIIVLFLKMHFAERKWTHFGKARIRHLVEQISSHLVRFATLSANMELEADISSDDEDEEEPDYEE